VWIYLRSPTIAKATTRENDCEIVRLIRPGLSSVRERLIADSEQRRASRVRLSLAMYKRTRGRETHRDSARIKDALAYT